eukprot:6114854-Amphidinium_carterae.2
MVLDADSTLGGVPFSTTSVHLGMCRVVGYSSTSYSPTSIISRIVQDHCPDVVVANRLFTPQTL